MVRKKNSNDRGETSSPRKLNNVRVKDSYRYGIEAAANENLKKLQEYARRVQNNEYMTASELADYRRAKSDYINDSRKLNDYARMMGGNVDASADKQRYDWLNGLGESLDAATDYYGAFKDADEYKSAYYSNVPYSKIVAEIERLKASADPDAQKEAEWLSDFAATDPDVIMSMSKEEYDSMLADYDKNIADSKAAFSKASDRYVYLTKLLTKNRAKLERGHTVEGMTMSEIQAERKKLEAESKEANNNADLLTAKKTQTERNFGVYKNWYVPENEEFNEAASNRNYTNPTRQQMDEGYGAYEKALQDIAYPRGGSVGEDGSVYDAEGNVLYDASKYDVEDKLGLFLSTSKEDVDKALTTLAGPAGGNSTYAKLLQEGVTGSWKELTDYEIKLYYYLYSSQGKDAAYQFLDDITTELNRREMKKEEKAMSKMDFWGLAWENVKSVPKNVLGGAVGFADDVNRYMRGEEINPYSRAHSWQNDALVARQEMAEDIDNATGNIKIPWINYGAGEAYQALMSGADSLVGAQFLGGTGYGALMGMGAASSTAKDLYERGASNDQIIAGSLLAGAAEMVFEKLSVDQLVSMKSSAGKKLIINMLKQGGIEASEEVFTEIANAISDYAIMGGASKYDSVEEVAKDVVKSGLSGFISGLGSAGVTGAKNNIITNAGNREKYGDKPVGLVNEILGRDPDNKFAQQMKAKLDQGKSLTSTQVTLLDELNTELATTTDKEKISKAVRDRLTELGETKDIDKLTKAITESVAKKEVNRPGLIYSSDFGEQVLEELEGRGVSTDTEWNARLGTDIVNPERYNRGYIKDLEGVAREYNKKASALPESNSYTETDNGITYKGITKDGTDVEVKGIDVVSGEIITDKGNYAAEDIAFADKATAALFENATKYNTPAVADLYVAAYNPNLKGVGIYNKAFEGIYEAALAGKDFDYAWNTFNGYEALDEAAAKAIWQAGYDEFNATKERRAAAAKAKLSDAATESKKPTKTGKTSGKVTFRNNVTADTKEQRAMVSMARRLAKIIGIDIEFFDSRIEGINANGAFDRSTDIIYLDMQKAMDDRHTIGYTLSHELTHFIEKWNEDEYNTFAEFLLEKYAEKGQDVEAMLARKMTELNTDNADLAYSELIADACESLLLDSNATSVLAELASKDKGLVEKIKRFFADILNKLRRAYKGLSPQSEEGKLMRKMASECEAIYRMFEDALAGAVENYQNAEVMEEAEPGTVGEDMTDDVQWQRKATDEAYMSAVKRGDIETAQKMVDESAKRAGYPVKVLHGTDRFGFTKLDVSKSDDGISFFATDAEETAKSYSGGAAVKTINAKSRAATKKNLTESKSIIADAVTEARSEYIRILGQEWYDSKAELFEENIEVLDKSSYNASKNKAKFLEFAEIAKDDIVESDYYLAKKYAEDHKLGDAVTEKLQGIYDKYSRVINDERLIYDEKSGVYDLYANTDGHLIIDAKGSQWNKIVSNVLPDTREWTTREVAEYAKENGYSGVTFKNLIDSGMWGFTGEPATVYNFFDPQSQVKSADPVTYDNLGRVIPLSKRFNAENKDIRFQQKLPSDRAILAEALESVSTTNEKDADIIRRYKAQMDTITKAETRLAEVNAEIKELSFAKGKRDTNRLALLHKEKTALTKKVNDFDKRLLRMESTEVLKNVLDREKAKVRAAANAKAKEKLNEVRQKERDRASAREADLKAKASDKLSAAKEKAAEREAAIIDKFRTAQEKGRNSRNKKKLIDKITNRIEKLSKLLNKPTKESHIKKGLRGTVGEAIALGRLIFSDYASNADIARYGVESVSAEEEAWLMEYRELLLEREALPYLDKTDTGYEENSTRRKQISARISQLNKKLESVFDRERRRLNAIEVGTVIDSLAKEYERLKDSDDSYIRAAYDSEQAQVLRDLSTDLGEVVKGDLTVPQLEAIARAYSVVAHTVATANKVFRNGRAESLEELVVKTQSDIERFYKEGKDLPVFIDNMRNFVDRYSWDEMKPAMAFERLGSDTFKGLYMDAVMADGVWGREIDAGKKYIDRCRNQHGADKWDLEASKTYTVGGRSFRVSIGEMMSIYALSKRDQAGDHITVGGFVHGADSKYMSKKGVLKWEQKFTEKTKPFPVTWEELSDMLRTVKDGEIGLTQEMKDYVDEMQSYFKVVAEKGNEISNVLFGIDLFTEENYFPIQSVKDYISSLKTAFSSVDTHVSLKNTGVTKPTTPNANNPIVLRNFDTVWAEHIDTMAKYYAYVLPIENMQRVFNTTPSAFEDAETSATKALITRTFGSNATRYFETYLNDLNGGTKSYNHSFFNFFGKWKKARVAMSMSTAIQQPFAVVRAMDMIDMKYFGKQPKGARVPVASLYEELTKYAPIAITKEIGGYDIGSSRSAVDYIDHKFSTDDVTMYLPGKADQIGWSVIWQAVKNEVAQTSGLDVGSEAYYERCGERFTEVIAHTQVYDSVNSRSGFMRSKSDLDKFATSFMGEPTTIINMLYSSMLKVARADGGKARAKAIGQMAKTYAVVLLSNALTKAAAALIYAGRDEDEDEGYWEKWVQAFGKHFISDLNPFASLPYFRDIVSALDGWDIERPDMAVFVDAIKAYQKLAKAIANNEVTLDDAMGLIGNVGDGLGVPISNAWRDLKGLKNTIMTAFDGVGNDNFLGALKEGATESLPLFEKKPVETKFVNLYDNGKTKEAKTYLADVIAEETAKKAEKDGITGELTPYQKHKYEAAAKTKVRGNITSELKPLYLTALKDKDKAATKRIRKIMAATGLYDNIEDTFLDWRREEVSEDFKDRYMEAWVAKDHKTMEKIAKEMVNTGLWKKPYATIKTWITNYEKGA